MDPDLWRYGLMLIQFALAAIQLWLVVRANRDYKRAGKMYQRAKAFYEREAPPEGPVGVWVRYGDGEEYRDLPTVFAGYDSDGIAKFEVLLPRDLREDRPVELGADEIPAGVAIGFAMRA